MTSLMAYIIVTVLCTSVVNCTENIRELQDILFNPLKSQEETVVDNGDESTTQWIDWNEVNSLNISVLHIKILSITSSKFLFV